MVLPHCRHHLEASLAESHHVASNLALQESPGWVREDPMGGGTGPRNVLSTTGQECEVSFSKVLRCVSGPNTVVAGAAWVAGVSRGGAGRCSSGALQDCCQLPVTAGRGAQAPAPPQTLSSHQCLVGHGVLQGSLGCRKSLECSLAPSLHLARAGMWCAHCHARHHPNTCGCTMRLDWWSSPSSGGLMTTCDSSLDVRCL